MSHKAYTNIVTLITRPKIIVLLLLLSFLMACVSVNNRLEIVSDANAVIRDTVSCEVTTEMNNMTINSQGLNPDSFTFLNWNIYKGNGNDWQNDLTAFAQSHDLMTIQEALLDEELTNLLEMHDHNWVMNTAFHLNGTAAGVMTSANSQALHSCGFKVKEPLIRVPKSTLISYYEIEGLEERLLVANIHGVNFTLGMKAYRLQLNKLYDAIQHHSGPMIVAGDFNSWNKGRVFEVNALIKKLSLYEIEYSVNNKTHVLGNAIDHVFYRQLELVSNRVWQVSSSDHNPISVSFRVSSAI